MVTPEFIAPITVDLSTPDNQMDIIKGLEHINLVDVKFDPTLVLPVEPGDWMVKGATGQMVEPGVAAVASTYPIWVGNTQYDSMATGNLTLITNGGFIYRTNKYVAGVYPVGSNLTIKGLIRVPQLAAGADPVLARVFTAPDSNGVMEIIVLDR